MRALALSALLVSAAASAQSNSPYWLGYLMPNTPSDPFRYYVDARVASAGGLTLQESEPVSQNAFAVWDAVGCSYASFSFAGRTTTVANIEPRDPYDAYNVSTVWITSTSDPYYDAALGGGAATASSIPLTYGGVVYQCDIYVNGISQVWSTATPTPTNKIDLQSFLTHEVGHCLGLGHANNQDSVMWPSLSQGQQLRTLAQVDVDAVCGLYPSQGAVGSPCTSSCTQPTDGGSALSCIAPFLPDGGTGGKFCSTGCDPGVSNKCPTPFVCKTSTQIASSPGACLPSYGDAITQVGKPCTQGSQCGSANGLCQLPTFLPSGNPGWKDGYCTQQCGAGKPDCPSGSACADFGNNDLRCIKTCRPGTGDCRDGYACLLIVQDAPALCLNACYSDLDCNGGAATGPNLCRVCDGVCLAKQTPTAQVGDPCAADSQCGTGQLCIRLQPGSSGAAGVCSQACTNSCTSCPSGSSCHVLSGLETPWCLRDCSTGSCAPGQRCAILSSGKACVPGCQLNDECPVGTTCKNGECTSTPPDAGCSLCGSTGGGGGDDRPRDGARDAGTGKPQTGGCGCQGVADAPLWAMLWVLALGVRRRWQPR